MTMALDFTGAVGANYVTAEAQSIYPGTESSILIYPAKGPFFATNMVVQYTDTNSGATTTLVAGLDYLPAINFPMVGVATGAQIYGALQIFNFNLTGTITLAYHALGGAWTMDQVQISNYINSNLLNTNNAFMALVANTTLYHADGVTPLTLDSVANITLAQTKYGTIRLGATYMPNVSNGSKSVGNQRVAGLLTVTNASGATLAGSVYVAIKNIGTGAITVAGGSLAAGDEIQFRANLGESIYPIAYTVPAGATARISTLA